MTHQLIGFDCNGKPLYAGDRCVLLEATADYTYETGLRAGDVVTVIKKHHDKENVCVIDVKPRNFKEAGVQHKSLRRLPRDQHQPADRSFADMMRGIKTLMPEVKQL